MNKKDRQRLAKLMARFEEGRQVFLQTVQEITVEVEEMASSERSKFDRVPESLSDSAIASDLDTSATELERLVEELGEVEAGEHVDWPEL